MIRSSIPVFSAAASMGVAVAAAFGLALRYAPSYTGLRDILQGVDPNALEAAFRAHANAMGPASNGMVAIAESDMRALQSLALSVTNVGARGLADWTVRSAITIARVSVEILPV